MRVAFFVQYCHSAGTYFRWHNLAIALIKLGHTVHVYAGDFSYKSKKRIEIRDGIEYRITPSLITSRLFTNPSDPFTAVYRVVNRPNEIYDVYHLFQPFLQAYLPWKYLKLQKKSKLFFYDWDDLWVGGLFVQPTTLKGKYVYSLVKYLERRLPVIASKTTVCSSFLANRIKNTLLIYNGFWSQANIERKEVLRKKWGLQKDIFYWAYIGKTASELNWISLAIRQIQQNELFQYKIKLLIVGPPISSIEEFDYGDSKQVQYIGEVNAVEAKELAKACDLGLMPLEENNFNKSRFPIKFFDFLSVGTPIYFSAVGELAKIATNIEGAIIGSSNKEAWARGLIEVTNKLLIQNIIVNIEKLESVYSWLAIAKKLEENYISSSDYK